jgi:PAS domain S-box-containing protein
MKLQHKIAAVYIATLGIAVTGTTIGLLLGRHHQQKALASWDAVVQEYTLLNQLQFKILYNRPALQLSPYLQDPTAFQQAIADFLIRLKEIDGILAEYQQMTLNFTEADLLLLRDYQQTVAAFARKLEVFGATVAPLTAQPQQAFAAEKALIELTKSPEFISFVEFQEPLMDLIDRAQDKVKGAKMELLRAENLRTQTASYSFLLSVAIASLAAIHLSRAIARQQIAWEAERASNQQTLQASHIRLQIAMEVGNMGTWDWQPQTNQVAFNREWKAMLGYAEHEIGNSVAEWQNRVNPEDIQSVLAEINKHIRGETPTYEKEHRLRCKDGAYKWILARGQIIERDTQGQPLRFLGVHYDISERKAAEIALRELSQQLKKAQEVAHLGYWSFDLVSQKITWSEEVFRIFGLDPSQGEPSFEENLQLYHPEERDFLLARVTEATQGIPQNFDTRAVRPSGEIRYANVRIEVELQDGVAVRIFGIIIDITDRKTEETLRALLSRTQLLNYISTEIRNSLDLETILQNAVKAIFVELKVDICSFGWYRRELNPPILEVVKEEKIPEINSWLNIYRLEDFPELFTRIVTDQIYTCDFSVSDDLPLRKFCQQSNISFYLAMPIHTETKIGGFELGRISRDRPWQDDEISLLCNIGTQVAIAIQQAQLYQESQAKTQELQKAYHDLQATQMQLIQAEKMSSLGQLVAGVAHEINNPVSFIYGNLTPISDYADDLLSLLQLYQECYPQTPEEINNLIADIDLDFLVEDLPRTINSMKTGAERIRDIVKSLRTFSRLDEADLKAVDLHENLDSTLVILQNRFNGKSGKSPINVVKKYGNLPLFECYIGLLNQVLMNLLVNAIQAIEERQEIETNPEYTGQVTITTTLNDNQGVSISVKDNGIGMSPEVQAKIFNPFFTTKPVGQGTGMGLPTSYQIVTKNHQGEFTFTSVFGSGTEFIIQLPFR